MDKNDESKNPTLLKIQDMIEYSFPQIEKFPRSERGYEGMATRLKRFYVQNGGGLHGYKEVLLC